MLIDCDACVARGPGCSDCVVMVLLGAPPQAVELDEVECQALAVLADGGLVPPLRLAVATPGGPASAAAGSVRSGPVAPAERSERGSERGRRRADRGRGAGELPLRRARHAAG
jgi:hypothetical protein